MRHLKIVVIDDNQEIAESIAEMLALEGYEVYIATNGNSGLALILTHRPTVVLCDIMMPQVDGYAVLELVQRNQFIAHIPFIFMSAKSEQNELKMGMQMGADGYLIKPFDDLELFAAISAVLKK